MNSSKHRSPKTNHSKKATPFRPPVSSGRGGRDARQPGGSMGFLAYVVELMGRLGAFEGPADATVSRYFKENPQLGAKDRSILAEAVYCWLRYRLRINHLAAAAEGPPLPRQAKVALLWSGAPQHLWSAGNQADNDWLSRVVHVPVDTMPEEARTCLPEWLYSALVTQQGAALAERFAATVLQSAPLDVRINTLKADPAHVVQVLQDAGVGVQTIAGLPNALRLEGKPALAQTQVFADGLLEVQDAGSQWVARLVAPRRGDLVIDFCAGAGGKTLALAALMKNTGRIIAVDVAEFRLQKLRPRAARAGVSTVYTLAIDNEADVRLGAYYGKADRVLVDAPCSGTGTLRRNPDLKFKHDLSTVAELAAKQQAILWQAARLVKADGRLIYITCSVLQEENEAVLEAFLAAHPEFRLRRWVEVLNPQERPPLADVQQDCLRLWPEDGGGDGFFAAVLQRAKTVSSKPESDDNLLEVGLA